MSRLLNIKQVMQVAQVKARSTIYDWMKDGRLPEPVKRWGHPRWDSEEVQKAISSVDSKKNASENPSSEKILSETV